MTLAQRSAAHHTKAKLISHDAASKYSNALEQQGVEKTVSSIKHLCALEA